MRRKYSECFFTACLRLVANHCARNWRQMLMLVGVISMREVESRRAKKTVLRQVGRTELKEWPIVWKLPARGSSLCFLPIPPQQCARCRLDVLALFANSHPTRAGVK